MAHEKRLIDAKELMENGWHLVKTGESNVFLASMSLADVPAVDAVEVKHGRWVARKICVGSTIFKCSECSRDVEVTNDYFGKPSNHVAKYYPYCHCGAKMDGGQGHESGI